MSSIIASQVTVALARRPDWSRRDWARVLGLPETTLHAVLAGRPPSVGTAIVLARGLGVSLDALCGLES